MSDDLMFVPHWMFLDVNPEPWAVGPVGFARKAGKQTAYVGQNKQLAAFEEAVAEEVRSQWTLPPIDGYVRLDLYLWRARAEYTTPNQRSHRKHEADATNMQKAIEDAMQGIVFANDRDNIQVATTVMDQGSEARGKIVVCVTKIEPKAVRKVTMDMFPATIRAQVEAHDKRTDVLGTPSDLSWPPKA